MPISCNQRFKIFLRKDNDVPTQRTTQERALVAGIWNDIEIDLASMDGTTGANDHNQSLFLFDFGVDSGADGDIYYIDALQMPVLQLLLIIVLLITIGEQLQTGVMIHYQMVCLM